METWVKNRLIAEGRNADKIIEKLLVRDPESGKLSVDFNNAAPMPNDLPITSGTLAEHCAALYLTSINPNVPYYGRAENKASPERWNEIYGSLVRDKKFFPAGYTALSREEARRYEKFVEGYDPGFPLNAEAALIHGKHFVEKALKYDGLHWLGQIDESGKTRWNAYNAELRGKSEIWFDTPWGDAFHLASALASAHPECNFVYEFAHEQLGYYAGRFRYLEGHLVCWERDYEGDKETYERGFELWGGKENYRFNARSGTYELIEANMENYKDRVCDNLCDNLAAFKARTLERSKDDVYDDAYKIVFMEQVADIIANELTFDDEVYEFLLKDGDNILDRLHDDSGYLDWTEANGATVRTLVLDYYERNREQDKSKSDEHVAGG